MSAHCRHLMQSSKPFELNSWHIGYFGLRNVYGQNNVKFIRLAETDGHLTLDRRHS